MSKPINAYQVMADDRVIRTIRTSLYGHAEPAQRERAARHEATKQLQKWFYSEQFRNRTLSVREVR